MIDVALTDVCDFQGGTQPPKGEWSAEELPDYIRMLQIRDFTQAKERHIEYVKNKTTLKTCNDEDILIGRYGASIGKILTGLSGAYNVAIVKTIPDTKRLDRNFLLHLLKGVSFQRFIKTVGSRAAQAGFNKKELTKFRFKLPPLAEQQKIAAILDAADSLRQKDQQLIDHYTTLSQSLFLEMFGDPVANPMGWDKPCLSDIAKFENGDRSSNYPSGDEIQSKGILFLSTKNINKSKLDLAFIQYITEAKFSSLSRGKAKNGDLLITLRGTLGNCCIFDCVHDTAFINAQIMIIRPAEQISPVFLHALITSAQFHRMLQDIGRGAAVPQLTASQLAKLTIICPSIEEQIQFAERIEAIEAQKQQAQASLEKSNALFNSLLQRAFNGELTGSKAA